MNQNMYNIDEYTDAELLEMLDLNHPTDRELEAKITQNIQIYENSISKEAQNLATFFKQVYDRFFLNSEEEEENEEDEDCVIEGMTNMSKSEKKEDSSSDKKQVGNIYTNPLPQQITPIENVPGRLNPLLKDSQKRIIHVDSQFRDTNLYPQSTSFDVIFSETLFNVLNLKLHSVIIPYTWYNISTAFDANQFKIYGTSPGIENVYSFTFSILPATYDAVGLANAINTSINTVATTNSDVNFGKTGFAYSSNNAKMTFTIDIQNVYTDCNYTVVFPPSSSKMAAFLGYKNQSYPLNSIYSNYYYCSLVSGYTVDPGDPIPPSNPNEMDTHALYDVIVDDTYNNIQGNNYFTIYSYSGTSKQFDASSSTIYDTIKISFFNTTGKYSRTVIVNNVNAALRAHPKLTSNSMLKLLDMSYNNPDGSTTMIQRYELVIELNRYATTKIEGMKQIVVFPDETKFTTPLKTRLWMGSSSAFLFDLHNPIVTCNNIISENPVDSTSLSITTSPTLKLHCTTLYYDNPYNQFEIAIPNSSDAGYPEGYTLHNYVGIYDETNQYKHSIINTELSTFTVTNGHVIAEMYVDQDDNKTHAVVDIAITFDQTTYTLDLSSNFLHTLFGLPSIVDISNPESNVFTATFTDTTNYVINGTNNAAIVAPKPGLGNSNVPSYTIRFPTGTYNLQRLTEIINDTFVSIQGKTDPSGTRLNGLNMSNTSIAFGGSGASSTIAFTYTIVNQLTETDYTLELGDNIPIAPSSWNTNLGFTQTQYVLKNYLSDVYNHSIVIAENLPYTNTMILDVSGENVFYLKPNIGTVGLYDASGTNDITITVPFGTYTPYTIHSAILTQFQSNPLTKMSAVQMYYDDPGNEYSLMRISVLKTYSAKDYTLEFYNEETAELTRYPSTNTTNGSVFKITTWDVTLGWQMGYRTAQYYPLDPILIQTIPDISKNVYTYDSSTNIITLSSDSPVNMFLYNNFYIKMDDYAPNRLNDGLVCVTTTPTDRTVPKYTTVATLRKDPNANTIFSVKNRQNVNYALTSKQLFASTITMDEAKKQDYQLFTRTPYMKDMFAVIPMKLAGLQPGQTFAEYGGTLQDNNRIYFGPVDIKKITIQLVNDKGELVDLNGLNWSFSFVCEYLYSISRD